MHAVRNIKLCTKDCVCLFVCPTGATDTETGQIDASRCLDGCRLCVDVCPSHAISLLPENYAEPKRKDEAIARHLMVLLESKAKQESIAAGISQTAGGAVKALALALERSNRILAEDCAREAAFMLPQSDAVRELLAAMLDQPYGEDFPADAVKRLLELL